MTNAPPMLSASAVLAYVEQFKRDGFVLIEDAVPRDFIESAKTSFMGFMDDKIDRFHIAPVQVTDGRDRSNDNVKRDFRPEGGNHDLNRWNMHVPTDASLLHEDLIANPMALPVIKALLGTEPVAFLIASDTPYPGSGFQSIHQDFPRFGLTVNIPLVDFTDNNAPLEVWPGSHTRSEAFHTGEVDLGAPEITSVAARIQGRRMLIKAGSILIRDQRLVHRGTANKGSAPRPCLSIWYKNLDHFAIQSLTIPVPHRAVANRMSRLALWMRRQGRGDGDAVKNKKLLNLGNFFGRVVEEASASDRDFRREIPAPMWARFSSEMRSLLRYAAVADTPAGARSMIGSALLVAVGLIFAARALLLKTTGR